MKQDQNNTVRNRSVGKTASIQVQSQCPSKSCLVSRHDLLFFTFLRKQVVMSSTGFSSKTNPTASVAAPSPPFAVLEIDSLALGYRVLEIALRAPGLKALDAGPVSGERFLIFLEGPSEGLRSVSAEVQRVCEQIARGIFVDHEIVENPQPSLIPGLFSLLRQDLGEALIIVETATVSGLVGASDVLMGWKGIEPIELKPGRGLQGKGMGFFSATSLAARPAAEAARVKLRVDGRQGRIEIIDKPSSGFYEFFNLSGRS